MAQGSLSHFYDDRYAGSYMESLDPVASERVSDVLAAIEGPIATVLDYGCGRGTWTPLLRRRFGGARLAGLDISAVGVRAAREAHPDVDYKVMSGSTAPFAAGTFDLVFSYHVLEHVEDLDATVADMARLVGTGGRVFAALPCGNRGSLEQRIVQHRADGVESTAAGSRFFFEDPAHLRRLGTAELARAFATHGFVLELAAYGNQIWGAVEWIGKEGPDFAAELCDPRHARRHLDALPLLALRLSLTAVARGFARRSRGAGHRRLPSSPTAVERLARREWRRRKSSPHASAQYLVFRAPTASRPCAE